MNISDGLHIYTPDRILIPIKGMGAASITKKMPSTAREATPSYPTDDCHAQLPWAAFINVLDAPETSKRKNNTVWCRYNAVHFLPNPQKDTPYLTREFNLWLSSVPVAAVLYTIYCFIEPRHSGTQLYLYFMISYTATRKFAQHAIFRFWQQARGRD